MNDITQIELQHARSALRKLATGEDLTVRESKAHAKLKKIEEEKTRAKLLRAVPQKDFSAMCGSVGHPRQTKQLQDMERQWGLPFAGATVDLFDFFSKLWDFLIEKGPLLRLVIESEGESDLPLGLELVKARVAKTWQDARAAELRNAEREKRLLDRAEVHSLLMSLGNRLRQASDAAQRKWQQEGYEFFSDLWTDFDAELSRLESFGANERVPLVQIDGVTSAVSVNP